MAKDVRVAHHDGLATGSRQSHVEFTVDGATSLYEGVGGEEIELVEPTDSERINDDITL